MSDAENSGSYDVDMKKPVESIREYDIMRLAPDYWEIWSRESRDDNIGVDTEQLRQLAAALQRILDHL